MGKLWTLIQEWRDGMQYPPSTRQIAKDIGVAPGTVAGWRDGLDELPKRHNIWALHRLTNIPFDLLMQSAIDDAKMLDPERAREASIARCTARQKTLSAVPDAPAEDDSYAGPDPDLEKVAADEPGVPSEGERKRQNDAGEEDQDSEPI